MKHARALVRLRTGIAVPKRTELGGALNGKVKRTAYHAVNARTSTHFHVFRNKYRWFRTRWCGVSSEVAGESLRSKKVSIKPRMRKPEAATFVFVRMYSHT